LRQHSVELKNMIPTLEKSLNDVTPLIKILVQQYGDFPVVAVVLLVVFQVLPFLYQNNSNIFYLIPLFTPCFKI